jgi:protein-S-isoprenylcysteine O-methyltransferase Ste14
MSTDAIFTATWLVWYVTWIAAVVWSARTKVQMKTDVSGAPRMIAGAGGVLMLWPSGHGEVSAGPTIFGALTQRLWPSAAWLDWGLYGALLCAFGFCWWARLHLGRLWSGFVTLKEDHHLVESGPYGLVRHPIYTGAMAAAAATALERASPVSILGALMVMVGFALVARTEERFLRDQLGAAAYDAYSRRVPMLAPWTGRARPEAK